MPLDEGKTRKRFPLFDLKAINKNMPMACVFMSAFVGSINRQSDDQSKDDFDFFHPNLSSVVFYRE